jgi:uncharacterized protein (DUF433 family)
MATTETVRIVREVHDEPHIAGRRITVLDIRDLVEQRGLPASEVADRYDLEIADVYAVLTYYYEHETEMAGIEQMRRKAMEQSLERGAKTSGEIIADETGDDERDSD